MTRKNKRRLTKTLVDTALIERVRDLENQLDALNYKLEDSLRLPRRVYKLLYPKAIDGPNRWSGAASQTILFGIGWLRKAANVADGANVDQDFKTSAAYER